MKLNTDVFENGLKTLIVIIISPIAIPLYIIGLPLTIYEDYQIRKRIKKEKENKK